VAALLISLKLDDETSLRSDHEILVAMGRLHNLLDATGRGPGVVWPRGGGGVPPVSLILKRLAPKNLYLPLTGGY